MKIIAYILTGLPILMSILLLVQSKMPKGWFVLIFKLAAGSISPYWAIMSIVGALIGWVNQAFLTIPMGVIGAGMMIWYIRQCTRDHKGFEEAFGSHWSELIPTDRSRQMVHKRWYLFNKMKATPEPNWERDIAFWTIPGTDRELLCDVWSPGDGNGSGLALVFFHGSGWYLFDKDMGTRPFFRHLVAQGHTVMDVAYRLCPEVDIYGMIGDVKRAVAWIKSNAKHYGVNPEKIVIGGASAGGHLSLLHGYAPIHPELTPEDVKDNDLSVCGIISYYGPTDLVATYQHEDQERVFAGRPSVTIGIKPDSTKNIMPIAGCLDILLGGKPQNAPHTYELASPVTYVNPSCPPTLLIQGKQDFVTSADATCVLHQKLVESGVPSINIIYPWTDHAFDLLMPQISPPAQSAVYDVDRFLGILSNKA